MDQSRHSTTASNARLAIPGIGTTLAGAEVHRVPLRSCQVIQRRPPDGASRRRRAEDYGPEWASRVTRTVNRKTLPIERTYGFKREGEILKYVYMYVFERGWTRIRRYIRVCLALDLSQPAYLDIWRVSRWSMAVGGGASEIG